MEFRILGPLEAVESGRSVALGATKQRALLAALLVHANEVVSIDRLIDELWGERPPAKAAKSVQVYVSQLRKILGDGRLETRGHGYLLHIEPGALDAERFQNLLAEGREALADGEPKLAAEALRTALALWRGPALSDVAYEPFAQAEIARLEELRLAALEERIESGPRARSPRRPRAGVGGSRTRRAAARTAQGAADARPLPLRTAG